MRLGTIEHDGLDWDEGNSAKIETRVSLEVIEDFFKQELLIKEDQRHSFSEERFLAMGYTTDPKRCLFVAYTIRTRGAEKLIRPISARFTHKKEEEAYETEVKKLKENN